MLSSSSPTFESSPRPLLDLVQCPRPTPAYAYFLVTQGSLQTGSYNRHALAALVQLCSPEGMAVPSSMRSFTGLVLASTGVLLLKWTVQTLHSGSAEQARQLCVQNKHHSNCAVYCTRYTSYRQARGLCSCKTGRGGTRLCLQHAVPQTTRQCLRPIRNSSVLQVPGVTAWSPWAAAAAGIGWVPASKFAVVTTGVMAALALRPAAQQPKSNGMYAVIWHAHPARCLRTCLPLSLSVRGSWPHRPY